MPIRTVGVCLKRRQPQAASIVRELVKWLRERGFAVVVDEGCKGLCDIPPVSQLEIGASADLIVALGGDGTLLSVARASGEREVPILGVNLGTLGFLTEVTVEEMFTALEKVTAGEAVIESRMRLEVVAERDGCELGRFLALNDGVITKTALSRMVDLETWVDGLRVTTYHADGLILSTPTGSTAYSLSAGGPLVVPGTEVIVVTPICPHSLTHRPLVLPQSSTIEVRVGPGRAEAALTVDGQKGLKLEAGDRITARRSPHPARIVASPFRDRYEILETKLRWGQR